MRFHIQQAEKVYSGKQLKDAQFILGQNLWICIGQEQGYEREKLKLVVLRTAKLGLLPQGYLHPELMQAESRSPDMEQAMTNKKIWWESKTRPNNLLQ